MAKRREIDERDIDQLLKALSDLQIAELFGQTEDEITAIRKSRPPKTLRSVLDRKHSGNAET